MPQSPLFFIGIGLFFLGGFVVLIVLATTGGLAKSRQIGVIGAVGRGERGRGARVALLLGGASLGLGACSLFAGVAAADADRRDRCEHTCRARGYAVGTIRAAKAPRPKGQAPAPVCACERGPAPDPLELRADALPPVPAKR